MMKASDPTPSPTLSPIRGRSPSRPRHVSGHGTMDALWVFQLGAFYGQPYAGGRFRATDERRRKHSAKLPISTIRDSHTAAETAGSDNITGNISNSRKNSLGYVHSSVETSCTQNLPRSLPPDNMCRIHPAHISGDVESLIKVLQVDFSRNEAEFACDTPKPESPYDGINSHSDSLSPERFEDEVEEIEMRWEGAQRHYDATAEFEKRQLHMAFKRSGVFLLCLLKLGLIAGLVFNFATLGYAKSNMATDALGNLTGTSLSASPSAINDNTEDIPVVFGNDGNRNFTTPTLAANARAKSMQGEEDAGFSMPTTNENRLFPPPPENLAHLCSGESDFMACAGVCDDTACCWQADVSSCIEDAPDNGCRPYTQACSVLNIPNDEIIDHVTKPHSARQQQSSGYQFVPAPIVDIEKLCKEQRLILPTTREIDTEAMAICKWACLSGECCWQDDGTIELCPDNPQCDAYLASCSLINDLLAYIV
jgi:hypothetical protein